jgi:uracil phosphoribosyltransferase
MRQLSQYAQNSIEIKSLLNSLVDQRTQSQEYADTFYKLGGALSDFIRGSKFLSSQTKVTLACSSEDADWLSKGILDRLENHVAKINLAVFWNIRSNAFENNKLATAPIIKTYIESLENVDVLIVCKSIINTSCVVRTNLTYLIERITPQGIFIVSPVLFKKAIPSLENEFPKSISDKFDFFYFAEDNEVTESGEVIPGIGGSVYRRLGLEDSIKKNKYIPVIVKERREANQSS